MNQMPAHGARFCNVGSRTTSLGIRLTSARALRPVEPESQTAAHVLRETRCYSVVTFIATRCEIKVQEAAD